MAETQNKRVVAFVDGQNLFNAAKMAFGYGFPNYDLIELAKLVCKQKPDWTLVKLHFYTGMPSRNIDSQRHLFWEAKIAAMGKHTELVQTKLLQNRFAYCTICAWGCP